MITNHKEVFDVSSDEPVVLSSSNSSILAWNSSTEFKMCLSRDKALLSFQATYLPRGTNGFFVAEWIALCLTCPRGLCLRVCLQLRDYPFHSEPRAVEEKFFLEFLAPFVDVDGFRPLPQGLRHAQRIDVVQGGFVVSLSLQNFLM